MRAPRRLARAAFGADAPAVAPGVERFYVARLQVVGAAIVGAAALVAAVVFHALGIGGSNEFALALVGVFLLLGTIGARKRAVLELEGQELRIRGFFEPHVVVLRRDVGLALGKSDLHGLRVTGPDPWVEGLYARDGGRTLLVPASKLTAEDRAKLEVAVRRRIER